MVDSLVRAVPFTVLLVLVLLDRAVEARSVINLLVRASVWLDLQQLDPARCEVLVVSKIGDSVPHTQHLPAPVNLGRLVVGQVLGRDKVASSSNNSNSVRWFLLLMLQLQKKTTMLNHTHTAHSSSVPCQEARGLAPG